jgi:hypothetical protein
MPIYQEIRRRSALLLAHALELAHNEGMKRTDPAAKFAASEVARLASIYERDALTEDEGYALADMEAEAAAELRNERWFEDRGAGHCDLGIPRMAPDGSGCLCGCS